MPRQGPGLKPVLQPGGKLVGATARHISRSTQGLARSGVGFFFAGLLTLLLTGCTPLANTVKDSIVEPVDYCVHRNEYVEKRRNDQLAETAWYEFESNSHPAYSESGALLIMAGPALEKDSPDCRASFTLDFGLGFKAGFSTYLFEGGSGNPPPVPPRCSWRAEMETPQGRRAIQDWFNGYRTGAAVARQSGYRELVTLPANTALPRRLTPAAASPAPGPLPLKELDPPAPAIQENAQ
jgi:hypothetical protein